MLANHLVCTIHQALLPSIESNKWELAYESFFTGGTPEIINLLAEPDRYQQLREMLARGDIAGSTPMNKVLAKLVADKRVNLADAQAATVDVLGLNRLVTAK